MSLVRETNGNVVLASGIMQLRFVQQFGGTPLEFWQYGSAGPLTNSFPGSGVSINFEVGQDPTQASGNAFTPHPISRIDQSGDRFYLRETLFDNVNTAYGVQGYIPDFWASVEAIDDYVSGSGWNTRYNPGNHSARLALLDLPVIFDGASGAQSGIFVVGNEMDSPGIRIYKDGWIAFKTTVTAVSTNDSALVGFLFQKDRGVIEQPTKDDLYNCSGLHLLFNMQGGWALSERTTPIASGNLIAANLTKLKGTGLQVEVRMHPGMIGYLELWFDGVLTKIVSDTNFIPATETWFGLFAQASAGYVSFGYRQIFDLNAEIISYYIGLLGDKILSHQTIVTNELSFYRANMPGVFMNSSVFPQKSCGVIHHNGTYEEKEAVVNIATYKSLWAGNPAGTTGILATVKKIDIDGAAGVDAHALIQKSAINNEFVMMLNPFSINWNTSPQLVKRVTVITEWATKRV